MADAEAGTGTVRPPAHQEELGRTAAAPVRKADSRRPGERPIRFGGGGGEAGKDSGEVMALRQNLVIYFYNQNYCETVRRLFTTYLQMIECCCVA